MIGKYKDVTLEGIDLKPGEPWFLIRGQDRLAPAAIEAYRDLRQELTGGVIEGDLEKFIWEVKNWQKNNEQFVKDPD